jgi:metal-responsive CopG/Arc/MetJ family transcriptional regulator
MHTAYERTSVSLPSNLMEYLKEKSEVLGTPVSRLIAAALREKMASEAKSNKRRASK